MTKSTHEKSGFALSHVNNRASSRRPLAIFDLDSQIWAIHPPSRPHTPNSHTSAFTLSELINRIDLCCLQRPDPPSTTFPLRQKSRSIQFDAACLVQLRQQCHSGRKDLFGEGSSDQRMSKMKVGHEEGKTGKEEESTHFGCSTTYLAPRSRR